MYGSYFECGIENPGFKLVFGIVLLFMSETLAVGWSGPGSQAQGA